MGLPRFDSENAYQAAARRSVCQFHGKRSPIRFAGRTSESQACGSISLSFAVAITCRAPRLGIPPDQTRPVAASDRHGAQLALGRIIGHAQAAIIKEASELERAAALGAHSHALRWRQTV
jgi:hypothetical protein